MTLRATVQDGTHPRPMMLRERWADLTGTWQLAHDDDRAGAARSWHRDLDVADRSRFSADVVVPYPPESRASGVGATGFHPVLWYRRGLRLADVADEAGLAALREGSRLVLRFGAVDFAADVWLDGHLVARHVGGQTPFSADVTDLLDLDGAREHVLVVRAVDEPTDAAQPRGKQDWLERPHGIWYERTSGIWQPVWAEVVPPTAVEHLWWTTDVVGARVHLALRLTSWPTAPVRVRVRLAHEGEVLAEVATTVAAQRGEVVLPLAALANHQAREALLWRPGSPTLLDAEVTLHADDGRDGDDDGAGAGALLDAVWSYVGLRDTTVEGGAFQLSGHPVDVRSVLAQNYWPDSHLAAPGAAALRREVELVRDLGFNAVRVHQKAEDPRFLHWCDRLGVMVWGEIANAYEFSATAVRRLTAEWVDVIERDASHPCVVTWVPVNESWGVGDGASVPAQRSFSTAIAELTRALDPTRPVVSNDGWEHTDSDLLTIHDYADTGAGLADRYGTSAGVQEVLDGPGPGGRTVSLWHRGRPGVGAGAPVMLTEFGGVRFEPDAEGEGASWGYSTAVDGEDYARRLGGMYEAVRASSVLAGSCWTQLTDTLQEANGLLRADRTPKIAMARLREIITGEPAAPRGGEQGDRADGGGSGDDSDGARTADR